MPVRIQDFMGSMGLLCQDHRHGHSRIRILRVQQVSLERLPGKESKQSHEYSEYIYIDIDIVSHIISYHIIYNTDLPKVLAVEFLEAEFP